MKIISITTLIISIFFTISFKTYAFTPCNNGGAQFGLINSNGYRSYIETTTFNKSILSYSHSNISNTNPTYNMFNFYYRLNDNLSYDIINKEKNIQEIIEININPTNSLFIKDVNILSEKLPNHQVIHHAIMLKRTGMISTGLMLIGSYSPYSKNGTKLLLHNKLSLKKINNLLLFEITKGYLSPNGNMQKDGYRVKNNMTLLPQEWLTIEPTIYYTIFTKYRELNLSLKLETRTKYNTISTNLSSKKKIYIDHKATLFQVAVADKVNLSNWYASIFIQTNYINNLYYNGKNKLFLYIDPKLSLELNHTWRYLNYLDQKIEFKLHFSREKWFIDANFTQTLKNELRSWELKVNLVQIF